MDRKDLMRVRGRLNEVKLRQEWFVGNSLRIRKLARLLLIRDMSDPTWPAIDPAICALVRKRPLKEVT
jgi:hypothetical protein